MKLGILLICSAIGCYVAFGSMLVLVSNPLYFRDCDVRFLSDRCYYVAAYQISGVVCLVLTIILLIQNIFRHINKLKS